MGAKESVIWDNPSQQAQPAPDSLKAQVVWDKNPQKVGYNPISSGVLYNLEQRRGDIRVHEVDSDSDLNDGERDWLKTHINYLSPEQFRESREVMAGRTEKQRSGDAVFIGNTMSTSAGKYYFSPEGIPVPISQWERPPDDQKLASLWGTQQEAADDSGVQTFAKSLWNGFVGLFKSPASIMETMEGLDVWNGKKALNEVRKRQGKGEIGMITEPFSNISKNFVDQISFETDPESSASTLVDTKAFESMSNFFNSENWHPSSQNMLGLTGQAIGSVLQFLVGGRALGVKSPSAWGSAPVSSVVASYAPSVGLASTLVLSDAIDSAEREGLIGREKYAVGLVNAIGQGVLEMAIGGTEKGLLGATVKAGVQKEISQSAVKAFKNAGGEITPQALKAAFGSTVKETVRLYPKVANKFVGQTMGEAGEEATQQLWSNSLMALDQKVHGREAKGVFAPEALKEYFTSALGGLLGGVSGGMMNISTLKDEAQGSDIYQAVNEGKTLQLRNGLDQLTRQGKMTQEQRDLADFRIQSYERYNTETKDVPLDNEQKQQVFNLTWNDQNVSQQIADLEANTTMTPAIKEAKIKVLKERSNGYIGEIAGIIKQAQPEQQKPEELKDGERSQDPAGVQKPMDKIREVAAKRAFANGPENDEDFALSMQYPKEISYETERVQKIKQVHDGLDAGRIKANGNISPEIVAKERIDLINQEIDAQIRNLDNNESGDKPSTTPTEAAAPKTTARDQMIKEKHERLTNKALKERSGFSLEQGPTESLAGKETLKGDQRNKRLSVKEGQVLDVQRLLPAKGERFFFPGMTRNETGYSESLTVHPEGEAVQHEFTPSGELVIKNNLGSIKFDGKNYVLINRLLNEGKQVKLVVVNHPVNSKSTRIGPGYIEYRVLSKKVGEKPAEAPAQAEEKKPVKLKTENVTKERARTFRDIGKDLPSSFEEAILRWVTVGKGKINVKDWEHYTGFRKGNKVKTEEYKQAAWYLSDTAKKIDLVSEIEELHPEMFVKNEQDAINEIFSVLNSVTSKSNAVARILNIQEKIRQAEGYAGDPRLIDALPEDLQAEIEYRVDLEKQRLIEEGIIDPNKEYSFEDLTKIINDDIDAVKFTEDESEHVADYYTETFDRAESSSQASGQESPEELESTFYASEREPIPANISEIASAPTLLSEQDAMDSITGAKSIEDLHAVMDAISRDKIGSPELYNAIIKRQTEIGREEQGGTPEDDDEINYQSASAEPLASSDPELYAHIQERLSKLFPGVTVFQDSAEFQFFLDKNFSGKALDLTKIGAAIGEAVYIDPKRARQSTQLHEYAHIYWNTLPKTDALKTRLEKIFGSEEAAVTAIGNVGTNAAKIKLSGTALTRALEAIRDFWVKVKNAIWPSSITPEQAAKIMADRIWKNADNVQATESGQPGPIKYMDDTASDAQRDVAIQLQKIAESFDYDDAAHTYAHKGTGIVYPSVTTIMQTLPEYAYSQRGERKAASIGKKIHKLAEAVAKGLDPRAVVKQAGLNISDQAMESLINQVEDVMVKMEAKGQVLSETVLANGDFGVAGMSDITIIAKSGKVSVFDFKSSTNSTNVSSYDNPSGRRVSKRQEHGTQLGMYARLIESDNQTFNMQGMEIDELGVIPIHYKVDKDGMITDVTVEKIIPVNYQQVRGEANRVFNEFRRKQEKQGQEEISGAKPLSEEEFGKEMEFSVAELKQQLVDIRNKPIEVKEKKRLIAEKQAGIFAAEDATSSYKRDMEVLKELLPEGLNLESKSNHELVYLHDYLVKYDNLRQNKYLDRILFEIANRLASGQMKVTGIDWANQRDISKLDIRHMAPSDVPENHPAVQAATKAYLSQKEGEYKATVHMEESVDKLITDLLKEKQITFKDKATARIASAKNVEKVYGNLYLPEVAGEWRALKDPYNPEDVKTLSPAELALLKHITDNMSKYHDRQKNSSRGTWQGYFPQVNKTFWENYYSNGLLFARAAHLNKDLSKDVLDVQIDFKNPTTKAIGRASYGEAIKQLNEYGKKSGLRSTAALVMLQQAKTRAIREAEKQGITFRESEIQKFGLSATGEMISRFQRESQTAVSDQSLDAGEAYKQYMGDMIHIDHMQPIMTELTAVRAYYAQLKVNPNMEEYLKLWIEGDVLGKHFIGQSGRKVDDFAKFMQAWTYMNVMAFNIKGGLGLNSVVGKFNQFRSTGGKEMRIGEQRYLLGASKKARAILKHYTVVNVTAEESVQNSARNLFLRLANGPVALAENWIQGAAFLGQMTEEEWANFDDKGNLIDKTKPISNTRLVQMKKKTRDVQGKYGFEDKRMYKHFAVHAAAWGFKGWMPDMLKERLGQQYTDLFGTVHKGSYRSLKYIMRDAWMMMSDPKNASKSTDVNVLNNKKNIREFMSFAVLFMLYAMSSDDKEEKKRGNFAWDAFTQVAGMFNLSSWEFLTLQPMPSLVTISKLISAVGDMFSFYERPGKYGDTGDWMFPGKVMQVLPYKKVITTTMDVEEFLDEE